MKEIITKTPGLRTLAKALNYAFTTLRAFSGSEDYWKNRYRRGGNSGAGSYDKLASFKADVLNAFVQENGINTVIEYGCGDGNQLTLAQYPHYIGFDVSTDAITLCRQQFAQDAHKSFKLVRDYADEKAELTLSLDVVYHLVEDAVFDSYMRSLFDAATLYVVIYSSDTNEQTNFQSPHVRHRQFSTWIRQHRPAWTLIRHIPNQYPYQPDSQTGSFADFYFYQQTAE
jgi:hypothetical protein